MENHEYKYDYNCRKIFSDSARKEIKKSIKSDKAFYEDFYLNLYYKTYLSSSIFLIISSFLNVCCTINDAI